jgi:hypothetical protein
VNEEAIARVGPQRRVKKKTFDAAMFTVQVIRIFQVWSARVILGFGIGFVPVMLLYFIFGVFNDALVAWDLFNSPSESIVDE